MRYEDGAPVKAVDVVRYYASLPTFAPIPAAKDTREDYTRHPVATGPYKFAADWNGRTLTLVKNREWSDSTDPGRHQFVDRFTFEFGLDENEIQQRIIADEGDDQYALSYNDLLADNYPLIRGTDVENRLVVGPSPCISYLWMDTRKIPLSVRRAVAEAWQALTKAGFTVKTVPAPSALAHDLASDGIRPINLRSGSWCMDWANGDSVLPAILDGRKAHLPGAPIQSFLNVDRVNAEIDRISKLPPDKGVGRVGPPRRDDHGRVPSRGAARRGRYDAAARLEGRERHRRHRGREPRLHPDLRPGAGGRARGAAQQPVARAARRQVAKRARRVHDREGKVANRPKNPS
ncbi:ABC transporter substrate-binding protein [Actinopolymorpha sp. B11F2]|uniref:ABC transporter substrate-binding protein n=1 Tax=Actinopolymorpha sp. B11F2 TaxID=3160862 RepID=UPI0032E3F08D